MKNIKVTNARTHNLKNVTIEIPKEKISVISGISGSGKSSLAFDTIFAEGQRRYIENLSSYARQVIGVIEKPDVDAIEGIPPAISIDQKSIARSPRSTVGTLTEIYDYLRLLFAHFGEIYCPNCQAHLVGGNVEKVIRQVFELVERGDDAKEAKIYALSVYEKKGAHKVALEKCARMKARSAIVDGRKYQVDELGELLLDKNLVHTIEIEIANIKTKNFADEGERKAIEKAIKKALEIGEGFIKVRLGEISELISRQPYCSRCNIYFASVSPRLFSFNSPYGACPKCQGLGIIKQVRPALVIPNIKLTIAEGAIRPWARLSGQNGKTMTMLAELGERKGFNLNTPIEKMSSGALKAIFYGDEKFEGVLAHLERKYRETDSDYLRVEIEQYMREKVCDECGGRRLNKFAESVKFLDKTISQFGQIEASELILYLKDNKKNITSAAWQIISAIEKKLTNLNNLGLGYLTLSRSSETLSGGEAQRIRLGVQFDSFLSGVLYVLDEPTISLHPSDTEKMIDSFRRLKDEGNTVLIVEHDKDVLEAADYIFDIGPGAGKNGGNLIASGTPAQLKANPQSLTGQYLSGRKNIVGSNKKRNPTQEKLNIIGATHNNLKNIDVEIPLGLFTCVTGVSGGGKSSLVYDILALALSKHFYRATGTPGKHTRIEGLEYLDKSIIIDQIPIGRTPRSNLATYTGLFTPIRELFASTEEAKLENFSASRFSFNLKGGRCESCRGDGSIKIEMYFMNDVYVPCEECGGKRYNEETLEIRYKEKTIADILEMSVDEAFDFFAGNAEIIEKITVLRKVGLGYLPLGQSATTLSGGEAQRIKLASELSRPSTGKTIYILDEPTTGLHFEDINKLLTILQELVERGNTVLVIEHNLDVIKTADWVIDLGPQGGKEGGKVVATGTPRQVAENVNSLTGQYLKKLF